MGHVVSNKGLKPDPSKVEAILKMEPPTDKGGVERLRGTVNYLSRFVPKLTDVMRPISDLPILKPGDTVRMKPFALGQKSWDKAHVTKRLDERSYEVQSAGTTFRRNRQHLVKTTQPTQFEQSVRDKATPNEIHDQQTSSNTRTSVAQTRPERTRLRPSPHRSLAGQKNVIPPLASHPQREKSPPHSLMQTRSGRIIKAPAKFKDYIMS